MYSSISELQQVIFTYEVPSNAPLRSRHSRLRCSIGTAMLCQVPILAEVRTRYNTMRSGIQAYGTSSVRRDVWDMQSAWESRRGAPQYSVNNTLFNPALCFS
jgi:hypothetical protein